MKCYSLRRKDLNFHYKKMSERYYILNGYNDKLLTQVYIKSLPEELHSELQQKLCDTQKLFSKIIQNKKKFEKIPLGRVKLFMWKKDLKSLEEKRDLLLITNP
ncbi:hypothetical protein ACOSQ2_015395 [Xanthoceras sorbifolium]